MFGVRLTEHLLEYSRFILLDRQWQIQGLSKFWYLLGLLYSIHTLRVHNKHAAANLNSGYSKYAKVARVHYFCTIAVRTSRAVLTQA